MKASRNEGAVERGTLFQVLFDNIQELVTVCEAKRKKDGSVSSVDVLDCNPAYLKASGIESKAKLKSKPQADLPGVGWEKEHLQLIRESLDKNEIRTLEICHESTGRWYKSTLIPVNSTIYIGTATDITRSKQDEKALAGSEERFRAILAEQKQSEENLAMAYNEAEKHRSELQALLDNAPMAIWIAHDPECRNITGNIYANEGIMKVPVSANISASAGEDNAAVRYRVLKNGRELKPEELPAQVAASTGKPVPHDTIELIFDDGRVVHLFEGAVPLFDKNGNVSGAVVTGIDVTLLRQAEKALIESNQVVTGQLNEIEYLYKALEQSRNKLNFALDNANIGIWEMNVVTRELIWDERMEKMFGINPGSFGKTTEAFEDLVDEEDLLHLRSVLKNTLESDDTHETFFRTRLTSKYIIAKHVVNRDSSGQAVSMMGVCFDVTGMKERSDKIIFDLNQELLRSNKELENFAYIASHDLQEPLRMVTSFTQMLQNRYGDKLDQDARIYIQFAVDGAKRMYEQLNGLLACSRIQTKGQEYTRVDMNKIIGKVKANLKLKLEETRAVIHNSNLPLVYAEETQMLQIMQNLVENGIKFSRDTPEIRISAEKNEGSYVFSVSDNGIGIEPQYHERIFRIFQRLHTMEKYAGTGIGLALCKRIVERHGGKIWLNSKPGEGSTFYFTIPDKPENKKPITYEY